MVVKLFFLTKTIEDIIQKEGSIDFLCKSHDLITISKEGLTNTTH